MSPDRSRGPSSKYRPAPHSISSAPPKPPSTPGRQSGTVPIEPIGTAPRNRGEGLADRSSEEVRASIARSEDYLAQARTYLERVRASSPPEPFGAPVAAMERQNFHDANVPPFDAHAAARILEKLAQGEHGGGDRLLGPGDPIVVAAALLLRDAKRWLARHFTPFESFAGDAILDALRGSSAIHLDSFASALRCTAIELIQVHKLLDLRGRLGTRDRGPTGVGS
jgi:hypothetical protein